MCYTPDKLQYMLLSCHPHSSAANVGNEEAQVLHVGSMLFSRVSCNPGAAQPTKQPEPRVLVAPERRPGYQVNWLLPRRGPGRSVDGGE